jgi:pimeloyl-ACP methyl ester carboxylesterase
MVLDTGSCPELNCSREESDKRWRDLPISSDLFPRGESKEAIENVMVSSYLKVGVIALCALGVSNNSVAQTSNTTITNIVLVHGAWADGSGWKGVYDILVKDGYNVSIAQEPETSFQDDVAATKRVIAQQEGPCILVAHSYGGAVITEAGTDPSVVALVYVAVHMPDVGENEADFAADLSAERAAFMARSQVFNLAGNFKAVITTAAWKSKPSWMLVAGLDRTINPELERWYATRANSHKVEVAGASHAVYVSHPKEVAEVIESAARAMSK